MGGDFACQFALELLRHQRVAVASGTAFGPAGEGWIRLFLAAETNALREGARRLAGFTLTWPLLRGRPPRRPPPAPA